MKRPTSIILLILISVLTSEAQSLIPGQWKFITGDNESYALPSFDDSNWKSISPETVWEKQGYANYDGFAWYRVKVVIPSSLRKDAERYGGFVLSLGKIDDVDFTWFNGELIGNTGSLPPDFVTRWNEPRKYNIPTQKVLWDKPNTLSVRVFDLSGDGGIYGGPVDLSVKGVADHIMIALDLPEKDHILLKSGPCTIPVKISNGLENAFAGNLKLTLVSDFGKKAAELTKKVSIAKNADAKVNFSINGLKPGFYKVFVRISGKPGSKEESFAIGIQPEKIISPQDAQPDFAEFWQKAKNDLASVDPQFKIIKVDSLCTSAKNIYQVEMRSLGNALIRAWYSVPVTPGRYPVVMQVPGYSSTVIPAYINYGDDIIGLGLNIRGHGNSKDDVNPGFPGYILNHIDNKDLYIYRGAYMDCARAIDFLFSRPEVDTTCIVVEGASQGGALTFATAALNNTRIKLCVPQVPFLSDFPDYFKVASWPGNEVTAYAQSPDHPGLNEVLRTLSYFDIKNLAPWIKAKMLMEAGLRDETCPPHINFAAYNQVTAPKSFVVYPEAGHSVPQEFYLVKTQWIRTNLGLK